MLKRILILTLLCTPTLAFAEIKYGLWSFDTEMTMPNMPKMPANMPQMPPGVKMPPGMSMPKMTAGGGMQMTFQHCITKEQLVPKNDKGKEDCKIDKMNVVGDTVNATMICKTPHGEMTGKFSGAYSGDSMHSTMDISGTAQGHPMNMHQETTGKYLGACPK